MHWWRAVREILRETTGKSPVETGRAGRRGGMTVRPQCTRHKNA
ncbi:hypothetical protein [Methanoculleus chikugoensis]|nr:hypothetical protein [Methanoculleus chikugoensis]